MHQVKQINSPVEVKELVDSFYEKVNRDPLLSPIFNDFARVDWEKHLPVMYGFWNAMLFGEVGYKGNPFMKHIPLPIEKAHFDRWIQLFEETIDERFTGEKAEEARKRAQSIAGIFQHKLARKKE